MMASDANPLTFKTAEAISEGHSDKVADQISDAIVDFFLRIDPRARVSCDVLVTTRKILLAGNINPGTAFHSSTNIKNISSDIEELCREIVKKIGFQQDGFDCKTIEIENKLHYPASHITAGIDYDRTFEEGSGNSAEVVGYATDETDEYMPAAQYFANRIVERLARDRHSGKVDFLGPESKCQLTLEYSRGRPSSVSSVVVSTQHTASIVGDGAVSRLNQYVERVINETIPSHLITKTMFVSINPTGTFVVGGPDGDAGLSGRNTVSDFYGSQVPIGGPISGRDPSNIQRSGAYMARYLAKNIVAAGLAHHCTVKLLYYIGVPRPINIIIDFHNSGFISERDTERLIPQLVDLSAKGIRSHLRLESPIYKATSTYGHFGRAGFDEKFFPWEALTLAPELKKVRMTTIAQKDIEHHRSSHTVTSYFEFEPVLQEAGALIVFRIQEIIGRIFQNADVQSELSPTSAFSFVLRINVQNDYLDVRETLKSLLSISGGEHQAVTSELLGEEIIEEMKAIRKTAKNLLEIAIATESKVDGLYTSVANIDAKVLEASQGLEQAFRDALKNLNEPFEALYTRLNSAVGEDVRNDLAALLSIAKEVENGQAISRLQVEACSERIRLIELRQPGFASMIVSSLGLGAISGTLGNLLTQALQAAGYWPL